MGQVPGGHPDWEAYFRKTFELLVDPVLPEPAQAKPAAAAQPSLFGGTGNTFNVCLGGTINQYGQAGERSAS